MHSLNFLVCQWWSGSMGWWHSSQGEGDVTKPDASLWFLCCGRRTPSSSFPSGLHVCHRKGHFKILFLQKTKTSLDLKSHCRWKEASSEWAGQMASLGSHHQDKELEPQGLSSLGSDPHSWSWVPSFVKFRCFEGALWGPASTPISWELIDIPLDTSQVISLPCSNNK